MLPHLWSAHCFMALGILEDISWYRVCRGSVIARSLTVGEKWRRRE